MWLGDAQLTSDGFNKSTPVWSPDGKRILYATLCWQGEGCKPEAVILNRAGVQERRFPFTFLDEDGRCMSVNSVDWSPAGIGVDCHANPSFGFYTIYDPDSGKPVEEYRGFGFVRSPDGRKVANAGSVPHFSPPFAHSDTIEIEHKVVYPKGGSNQAPPDRTKPDVWRGIHELRSAIAWSPDGNSIAFVERVYDWRQVPDGVPYSEGDFNARWQLVVASPSAAPVTAAVKAPAPGEVAVSWTGPSQLTLASEASKAVFEIRGRALVPAR